ncbi:MAG: glycosyltransferase [Pseudomonadota bacterium]
MTSRAPFSVVIPCYNMEDYIGETLWSLVAQEILPEEVIVIDDGSTDLTVREVEGFNNLLDIKLISIKNSGQGVARNIGIARATAPYIYFLDADDKIIPGMLAMLAGILESYDWPDLLFFSGQAFHDLDYRGDFSRSYARKQEFPPVSPERAITFIGRDRLFSASPCMYISRRSLWGEGGVSFKSMIHEDEEILYRLVLASDSVATIGDVLFLRRLRNNSTMTETKTPRHVYGRCQILRSALDDLKFYHGLPLAARWALRKRVFWMALSYFKVCDQAKVNHSFWTTFGQVRENRSPELFFAILIGLVLSRLKLLS